jgi:hypothetical protein
LRDLEHDLVAAGARVVYVGTGAPDAAASFAREQQLCWPVLSDASGGVFTAAGARRGLASLVRLRVVKNGLRALRAGHRQSRIAGDPWRQGGALVFGPDGALVHAELDAVSGDALDGAALLAAVRGLGPERTP